MTYASIKSAVKEMAVREGGEFSAIYESLVRLDRTDKDSAAGLHAHLEAQGFKNSDEVREYIVCEL